MKPVATANASLSADQMQLRYCRIRVGLRALTQGQLPPFLGSTIRGAMAWCLKNAHCTARRRKTCRGCPSIETCVYALVFESPVPSWSQRLRSIDSIPHPLVLENISQGGPIEPDAPVTWDILLFGRAIKHANDICSVLNHVATRGLGVRRIPFALTWLSDGLSETPLPLPGQGSCHPSEESIADWMPRREPPGGSTILVRLLTPLRMLEEGRLIQVPTCRHLVRSVLSRASSLSYFFEHQELDVDFKGILAAAQDVSAETRLAPLPLERYSNRQRSRVPLEGVVGSMILSGPTLDQIRPWLQIGELLHVGKGTVFGLGQYCLEPDGNR